MAVTIDQLSRLLTSGRIRHHIDEEERVIRVALVTRRYVNPRAERLAIVRIEAVAEGRRCRVSLGRAFAAGRSLAATCLALCRAVADVSWAAVEPDTVGGAVHLVIEMPVEDGRLTSRQLLALLDAVVEAAEAGQAALHAAKSNATSARERSGAAGANARQAA